MTITEIIDLTRTFEPGVPGYERSPARQKSVHGWNASTLHIYSHAGTHMDAPSHFEVSSQSIDQLHPRSLYREGILIDVPGATPGMLLGPELLQPYERKDLHGKAVLFHTGWSHHFHDQDIFRNGLPRIGTALAQLLVDSGVAMVGVEPPSVADVNHIEELTSVHETLMKGGVIIVEGLCCLERLSGKKFMFMALPLKVADGDGAPARAVAMITP